MSRGPEAHHAAVARTQGVGGRGARRLVLSARRVRPLLVADQTLRAPLKIRRGVGPRGEGEVVVGPLLGTRGPLHLGGQVRTVGGHGRRWRGPAGGQAGVDGVEVGLARGVGFVAGAAVGGASRGQRGAGQNRGPKGGDRRGRDIPAAAAGETGVHGTVVRLVGGERFGAGA